MMNIKRFLFATFAAALTLTACFAKPQTKVSLANNVGELSWSSNYTVDAQKFEGASEGSVISIDAQQTKADYHKFKVYSMGNGWKELGSGGVTGASFANGEISVEKPSCTISIKLTNQEAEELKKGGMVLHGFGLSIKKMELTASSQKQNGKQEKSPKHEKPGKQEKSAKTANANLPFDLGNWKSIVLPAESIKSSGNFSIKISTKASNAEKNPSYFNIKLYVPENSSWTPLGKGNLEPAQNGVKLQGDLIVLPKADNTFVYTPTNSERNAIKKNGLVVQGYGMSVTEVNSVTVAELHSKPDPKKAEPKKPDAKKPEAKKPEPLPSKKDKESPAVSPVTSAKGTPYANHGKLHVTGTSLCDSKNQPYQLYGMSTHGLSWYPEYVSKESFTSLRDDWNTNCVRLVLYPGDYMGYCNGGNKEQLKRVVYKGIEEATALGMYVIVDWHIHNDNPNKYKAEAKKFLDEVSKKYASYGNVLYEICNEPVNAEWNSQIKPYAEEIIPVIRKNAPDAIIIVGTNTWSQDVDKAAANPITKYKNIMYTFHFYANTHTDSFRSKVEGAIKAGLPIFITEFGTCDASGNGGYNENQSKLWFNLIKKYNLSHMNWSLCNKAETASAISASCQKKSGWTEGDLSQSGRLIRSHFRSLSR